MARASIWDQIMRHARAHSRPGRESHVKVGVLQSAGGAQQHGDGQLSIVELAAVHEFGAPRAKIPERSFLRRAMREQEREYKAMAAKLAKAYISGRITYERALNMLGAWGAAAIKNRITGEHIPPPLKPATVEAKGSDRPLVDTGRLLNSITWKVWLGRGRDSGGRFIKTRGA